ncbi:MAG: thioesterase family protein [Pseudomonadales bacterium]|nr:thioesterase family protein [Pseudomonadales bacterium]
MSLSDAAQARFWDQERLAELLNVIPQDSLVFTGDVHDANLNGRVFGGQLLAQAFLAARHCCPDKQPATLHCLFLQGALPTLPITYQVTPLQEGKRFASFHVSGLQQERRVLDAQVSFQVPIEGFFHVEAAPAVPDPEELPAMSQLRHGGRADWGRFEKSCAQLRIVDPQRYLCESSSQPNLVFWVKLHERLPEDDAVQAAGLAISVTFGSTARRFCTMSP